MKLGLWSLGWEALIPRADDTIHNLLQDYANALPPKSAERTRQRAIVERRMKRFQIY